MPETAAGRALLAKVNREPPIGELPPEDVEKVEAEARALGRAEALAELESYAKTHAALVAGRGRTDDILGFIDWYRAAAIDNLETP